MAERLWTRVRDRVTGHQYDVLRVEDGHEVVEGYPQSRRPRPAKPHSVLTPARVTNPSTEFAEHPPALTPDPVEHDGTHKEN